MTNRTVSEQGFTKIAPLYGYAQSCEMPLARWILEKTPKTPGFSEHHGRLLVRVNDPLPSALEQDPNRRSSGW